LNIRAYTDADFPTLQSWAEAREMQIHPALLSPQGFLVEDDKGPLAVCFVYLVFDVPFVFMDNLWSRPNTSLKDGRKAWAMIWRTTLAFLSNLRDGQERPIRYKFVRNFCRPELARLIKRDGWKVAGNLVTEVIYALPS
jgi:hypothetical protein